MAPHTDYRKPDDYTVYQQLSQNRSLLKRKRDGHISLAHPFDIDKRPALQGLRELYLRGAGGAAEGVLNHENLLCVVDHTLQTPLMGGGGTNREDNMRSIHWDWCDAGTLDTLMDDPAYAAGDEGYLPESLVWHVGLSMLRALQWLHEGMREEYTGETITETYSFDLANPPSRVRVYPTRTVVAAEEDWLPILHGAIEPRNIFFQEPRGRETYGLCKLGHFGQATVCSKIVDHKVKRPNPYFDPQLTANAETNSREIMLPLESPLICAPNRNMPISHMYWYRAQWKNWDGKGPWPNWPNIYTQATELANLGKILFQMMTGIKLPASLGRCMKCGCQHTILDLATVSIQDCGHECRRDITVWYEMWSRPNYSTGLKEAVYLLLKDHDNDDWSRNRASIKLDDFWHRHMRWRFPNGRESYRTGNPDPFNDYGDHGMYRDTYDEVAGGLERKREEERKITAKRERESARKRMRKRARFVEE